MRPPPPDPVPALKEAVARAIVDRLQGWTQVNAAELLRTDQPRVSDLRNGRLERFSLEKLVRLATRLRGDVTIDVRWDPHPFLASPR
jgi:predicted XRE-type DNA-binding protein